MEGMDQKEGKRETFTEGILEGFVLNAWWDSETAEAEKTLPYAAGQFFAAQLNPLVYFTMAWDLRHNKYISQ